MKVPDLEVKKTLYVGQGDPSVPLGKGPLQIRGGAYIESPAIFGQIPPFLLGNVNIGPAINPDITIPPLFLVLCVLGSIIHIHLQFKDHQRSWVL